MWPHNSDYLIKVTGMDTNTYIYVYKHRFVYMYTHMQTCAHMVGWRHIHTIVNISVKTHPFGNLGCTRVDQTVFRFSSFFFLPPPLLHMVFKDF